jgi:hypothetical protein
MTDDVGAIAASRTPMTDDVGAVTAPRTPTADDVGAVTSPRTRTPDGSTGRAAWTVPSTPEKVWRLCGKPPNGGESVPLTITDLSAHGHGGTVRCRETQVPGWDRGAPRGPHAMLGFARRLRREARLTKGWRVAGGGRGLMAWVVDTCLLIDIFEDRY